MRRRSLLRTRGELRKYTVRVTRKFPKSYRDTTNGLTELAREIYLNAIKGTRYTCTRTSASTTTSCGTAT